MFVYNPSKKRGEAYKLARPFVGVYLILQFQYGTGLQVIASPTAPIIRVALNRIRLCPIEIKGSFETRTEMMRQKDSQQNTIAVKKIARRR